MASRKDSYETQKRRGPKTPEGRKRVSQNARKHGLTGAALSLGRYRTQAMIAEHLGPGLGDPVALARLAEAEAIIARTEEVLRALERALEVFLSDPSPQGLSASGIAFFSADQELEGLVDDLRIVFRYRAEAWARRRKAQRSLLASLTDTPTQKERD